MRRGRGPTAQRMPLPRKSLRRLLAQRSQHLIEPCVHRRSRGRGFPGQRPKPMRLLKSPASELQRALVGEPLQQDGQPPEAFGAFSLERQLVHTSGSRVTLALLLELAHPNVRVGHTRYPSSI